MDRQLLPLRYRIFAPQAARIAFFISLLALLMQPSTTLLLRGHLPGASLAAPAATVEKELADAQALIAKGKLNDARNILERARLNAGGSGVTTRINRLSARIIAIEDSLVKVNLEILRTKGADAAFEFMQEVVWSYGVSKEKLDLIENTILNEAPAVQETQERDDLEYALKLLATNQPMDPAIDPYIVKTAEMLMQARADSIAKAKQAVVAQEVATTPAVTPAPAVGAKKADTVIPPDSAAEAPVKKAEPVATVPEPAVEKVAEPVREEATVQPKEEPVTTVAVVTPPPKPKPTPVKKIQKPEEYVSPALQARAKATKEYLKKLKANQQVAQKNVVE
ncbi:MAG: hypothetical protein JXA71_05040, partial [Chitinispirillaceae bacterium]|nr:hypothetical protein [Chitinispirillaceae bacterium]